MVAIQVGLIGIQVGDRVEVVEVVILVLTIAGRVVAKASNHRQTVPVGIGWDVHVSRKASRLAPVGVRVKAVNVWPVNQLGLGPANLPTIVQHNDVRVLVVSAGGRNVPAC